MRASAWHWIASLPCIINGLVLEDAGMISRFLAFGLAVLGALSFAPQQAAAQPWPARIVKFILPLGAGSGADTSARLFADRLSKRWGQPVVVENRPGGDGIVALGAFAAARDDHILLFAPTSTFTAHPFQHENLPYKEVDLAPIARVSNTVVTLSVPAALKVESLRALIERVRAEPGKLNWAGVTGALDFLLEGFLTETGLAITKVPYRNPVEAASDLAENRVQFYESALAIVQPHVQAGKINILAITNTVRAPAIAGIPTVAEAGFPQLTVDGLSGLFGPARMPMALRERIASDIGAVSMDPVIVDRLTATGQFLNVGGPAEFAAAIRQQRDQVAAIAKVLGVAR
jgi:tripartite-type tricarboxylate transporter receptor subunit TctC